MVLKILATVISLQQRQLTCLNIVIYQTLFESHYSAIVTVLLCMFVDHILNMLDVLKAGESTG